MLLACARTLDATRCLGQGTVCSEIQFLRARGRRGIWGRHEGATLPLDEPSNAQPMQTTAALATAESGQRETSTPVALDAGGSMSRMMQSSTTNPPCTPTTQVCRVSMHDGTPLTLEYLTKKGKIPFLRNF